jgi:hypothetical protein
MRRVVLPGDTTGRLAIAVEHGKAVPIDIDPVMNPIPMVPATERRAGYHADPGETRLVEVRAVQESGKI